MSRLRKAEWGAALLLTFLVFCLHLMAATSVGPLWRDEANTVALATLPGFGDVWRNLQFDSFPMLWLLIVRCIVAVFGPMNDAVFRGVGFLIGMGLVASLWFIARSFGHSLPLVSLALLGMSPSMIRWGDSIRAYGFGILLILVTCALLWRFVDQASWRRFAVATIVAIASVHALYYNAVLLLAFCAGAAAVGAHRRAWKTVALVLVIGLIAAVSLVPYRATIQAASSWNMLVQVPSYSLSWFWNSFARTVDVGWLELRFVWLGLLGAALAYGTFSLVSPRRVGLSARQYDVMLFFVVSLVVGVPGSILFLRLLSYHTAPWYYLTLMALASVCVDGILGAGIHGSRLRVLRLAGVVTLAAAAFVPTRQVVRMRMSDADLVAAKIHELARPGDLVVVAPWYYGISFGRYYRGATDWMTVPPLPLNGFHRYDLLKLEMIRADQTAPARAVMTRAEDALSRGHRVFVAGFLAEPWSGAPVRILTPATSSAQLMSANQYETQWSMMVGEALFRHAMIRRYMPIEADRVINPVENLSLQVLEGWRR
ncbi:MAG TPA: glycosyltransferase family 39 protein [Lysobacter sp.]|nr:glycosyltransferase family 39 protein [Lysobacter sp.]